MPDEFWSKDHLSTLLGSIGTLVKLDKFTAENDEKAQFARVCLNIDISKPIPCSLKMTCENTTLTFFLSYEGVHEVCPLCGKKDHTLSLCPNKPISCLDHVVAQLEANDISNPEEQHLHGDWIFVKPQRRGKPRFQPRGGKVRHTPFPNPFSPKKPHSPQANTTHIASLELPGCSAIPTSNTFATLGEFQIASGEQINLNPPSAQGLINPNLASPLPANEEYALDDAFFNALVVIHHNPHIMFDAEMTLAANEPTVSDSLKRRKRDEGDDSPTTSNAFS